MLFDKKKEAEITGSASFQSPPPAYEDESTASTALGNPSSSVPPSSSTSPRPRKSLAAFLKPFAKRIRAADTPQWAWSNAQCREWLAAVLVEYCNRDPVVARELADNMFADGGFGPRLYTTKLVTWEGYVGKRDAEGIHGLLLSLRKEKGAVPASVKIDSS
ncbi:hypothetical protein N431DRAFT_496302 [Stipitochalara longipes BDJ]|nr:hypothetical protein N431DRAFT_496302 [Stipitochalara longipes BDJ]